MTAELEIRRAEARDLPAITGIYNIEVKSSTATLDTESRSDAEAHAWFGEHTGRYPVLVAEADGTVVGWASVSRWSDRKGYDGTAEISYYVKSGHRSKGIGRRLVDATVEEARKQKFHTLLARIGGEREVSLKLCRNSGFTEVGVMKEVGHKFGRLLDVHLLQKIL